MAAIALEVARTAGLPGRLAPLIERAACLHLADDLGSNALVRLAAELESCDSRGTVSVETGDLRDLEWILELFRGKPPGEAPEHCRQVADILWIARMLDEQLEAQALDYRPIDTILEDLESIAVFEVCQPQLVQCVRQLRVDRTDFSLTWSNLPVQAKVARQVVRCLEPASDTDFDRLDELASSDAVLAGAVTQVANSSLYSPRCRIGKIREAISYIGVRVARKVMLAAAVRPLFASAGLRRLWSHSLEMAQLCSALAKESGILDPQEALLLGLVHDIGALVVQTLPGAILRPYQRLTERGCPPSWAEQILFGRDHGEIGAEILTHWSFPPDLIEAVRFHHQPERSAALLAPLVYLAEAWSGQEEDLSCLIRLEECGAVTGISLESLATAHDRESALTLLGSVA